MKVRELIEMLSEATVHTTLWLVDGQARILITQPYSVRPCEMPKMHDFAERHGLTFSVSGFSWYYPGRTLMIQWEAADKRGAGFNPMAPDD